MIALVLLTNARSCALTPSSPARAPRPSEVSNPIVTIDISKMTLALEEGSKNVVKQRTAQELGKAGRSWLGVWHPRGSCGILLPVLAALTSASARRGWWGPQGCFVMRELSIKLRQKAERVCAGSAPGEFANDVCCVGTDNID